MCRVVCLNVFSYFFVSAEQLASKKGGLGAQKVSSQSFSAQEKRAQAVDKRREEAAAEKSTEPEEPV